MPFSQVPLRTRVLSTYPFQVLFLSWTTLIWHTSPIWIHTDCCSILNTTSTGNATSAPFTIIPMDICTGSYARFLFTWSWKMRAGSCWNWTRWMIRVYEFLQASGGHCASPWTTLTGALGHWGDFPSGRVWRVGYPLSRLGATLKN